jgi:uncharacterized damage-inducible protein DinB
MPSRGLAHYLSTMAYQNGWANHRLLRACAQLSDDDFAARRVSFFPSIKATLNHIVTVDAYYVDALERWRRGEPVNPDYAGFFDPEEPFDTCAALSAAQHAVDRRLVALSVSLDDGDLEQLVSIMRAKGEQRETVTRMLSHLFEHQIHHRGQAHAMLAGTNVPPPQLDEFFCANDAPLRAVELAELGWSEALIWDPPE